MTTVFDRPLERNRNLPDNKDNHLNQYDANERPGVKHGSGPNTKGGGFRGGPKRWTGAGPRPARHIPWPEIFKHHISVVEGHLKMMEMVKKHTVPDTGNWNTICPMVDRCYEMIRMAKIATRTFIPPANQMEQVPVGVSSASMYPGYSPADHEYGQAAQEFGKMWSGAKEQGIDFKIEPDGPQYEIGQAKGRKRGTLAQIRAAKISKDESGSGNGSGSGAGDDPGTWNAAQRHARAAVAKADADAVKELNGAGAGGKADNDEEMPDADAEGANTYFVIDTNPTPVSLPHVNGTKPAISGKRAPEEEPSPRANGEDGEGAAALERSKPPSKKASKKVKTKHDGPLPSAEKVDTEDITAKVDARLREKEEKRKRKEEKNKRKRESEGDSAAQATLEPTAGASAIPGPETAGEDSKPMKKKSKQEKKIENVDADFQKSPIVDIIPEKPKKEKSKGKKRAVETETETENARSTSNTNTNTNANATANAELAQAGSGEDKKEKKRRKKNKE